MLEDWRVPCCSDGFEFAGRSIIGRQIDLERAQTLAGDGQGIHSYMAPLTALLLFPLSSTPWTPNERELPKFS
jgi:hypothetical protein